MGAVRVLVAEDEPIVRMVMVETLEDAGLVVLEASSGTEACVLIDDPDNIDLLVTDLNMPGCDGVEVARKARMRHPSMPVLYVSGRMELLEAAGAVPPYRTLRKPFDLAEFAKVVGGLVDGRPL
jgi:CheY-like chemotaxis protein